MKKLLLFPLFASLSVLAACGNNDLSNNLSFEEAKDIATKNSHLLSDLLLNVDTPIQQDFSFTTTIVDGTDTSIDLALTTQSQQDQAKNTSKTDIAFDANITTAETPIATSGQLTALLTPETMFINIEKF
jgi:hypothetical protein